MVNHTQRGTIVPLVLCVSQTDRSVAQWALSGNKPRLGYVGGWMGIEL